MDLKNPQFFPFILYMLPAKPKSGRTNFCLVELFLRSENERQDRAGCFRFRKFDARRE